MPFIIFCLFIALILWLIWHYRDAIKRALALDAVKFEAGDPAPNPAQAPPAAEPLSAPAPPVA